MKSSPSTVVAAPRVLVVEDEPMLRTSVVTGLSRLPGVEVTGVGSLAEALTAIDARAPAVVLSDIDLPDRSGIELLGELGVRGLKPHVVFVSAYIKAYRAQIPPHARVDVLEKPVSLEDLRELVTQRLSVSSPSPSPFGVADYLQLASLGRHSVRLTVSGSANGTILVVDGQAWSADDERGSGPQAFQRLALATGVMVTCATLTGSAGPRNLEGSAESLLLECARLADESALEKPPAPEDAAAGGSEGRFTELSLEEPQAATAPEPASARTFAAAFELGLVASLRKDYASALTAFREAAALEPTDPKVQINIARLEKLLAGSAT